MPRALSRLQRKRSQGEAMNGATFKRPRRNRQPSQPTIFPQFGVQSLQLTCPHPPRRSTMI